jgi:hypothetical protein
MGWVVPIAERASYVLREGFGCSAGVWAGLESIYFCSCFLCFVWFIG